MKSIKFLIVFVLIYLGSLAQLYSQKFLLSPTRINNDSIIDIVYMDSSIYYRVFSEFIKIEKSEDGNREIHRYGIISSENRKVFFEKDEHYIGHIDDYFYTTKHRDKNAIVNCYKLDKGELLLAFMLKLDVQIGYFQIHKFSKIIIYINSAEGFGNNIMLFDKALNQVLDYKPFDGLFNEYTISGDLTQSLFFSFHSDDNPYEYKIICYDHLHNQIADDITIQCNSEYFDQIVSCSNGNLVFSNYDLKNYYITKYNYHSEEISGQSKFNFDARITCITENEILLLNNNDLCSINISSLTENWKLNLIKSKQENIVITDCKKICNSLINDSINNYCFIISRFDRMNNLLIGNDFYIINDSGQLVESFLLPKELIINSNPPLVLSVSSGIKIISGVIEINLIKN